LQRWVCGDCDVCGCRHDYRLSRKANTRRWAGSGRVAPTTVCPTGTGCRSHRDRSGLDELVTTTTVLALDRLLAEDSTFYGDLFPHAVKWQGVVYLEDGLHRAVRAALRN
jgi:Arc/MetJ family transcription regulator